MRHSGSLERTRGSLRIRRKMAGTAGVWSVLGGVALVAVAYVIVRNLPDIRRYIKMEMM